MLPPPKSFLARGDGDGEPGRGACLLGGGRERHRIVLRRRDGSAKSTFLCCLSHQMGIESGRGGRGRWETIRGRRRAGQGQGTVSLSLCFFFSSLSLSYLSLSFSLFSPTFRPDQQLYNNSLPPTQGRPSSESGVSIAWDSVRIPHNYEPRF
jgi:hypothetical protein